MLDKILARDENVAWRIIDGEAIILSAEDSSVHSLDEVGTKIWELADGKKTVKEIIEALHEEYDVEFDQLKQDVLDFITELQKKEKSLVSLL